MDQERESAELEPDQKKAGRMSQFVKRIFTENTGGGCMVDMVVIADEDDEE